MSTTTTTTTTTNESSTYATSPWPSSMFPQAHHYVSKKNYHNEFSSTIPPVCTVQPGELIHVETNDCFHGQLHPALCNSVSQVADQLERRTLNPVTGPIYVEGAAPGDWLAVSLKAIQPQQGVGVACCGPHSGQLCHWVTQTHVKFFDLSEDGKMVTMRENVTQNSTDKDSLSTNKRPHKRVGPIQFPSQPMLGVIGVAPPGSGKIDTMPAGHHGGNLDNNCHGVGSTIYLKVNHPGGLLSIGDMHARQGDGEISGTGVEMGGHVLLQCHVVKQHEINCHTMEELPYQNQFPVTETATHWITHGVAVENIPYATQLACQEAACILTHQWGFTPEEAFIFLSTTCDLSLCQACHPDQGTQIAKLVVPKLPVCPRPFRCLLHDDNQLEEEESNRR